MHQYLTRYSTGVDFFLHSVTTQSGKQRLQYLGLKMLPAVPKDIKNLSLTSFIENYKVFLSKIYQN